MRLVLTSSHRSMGYKIHKWESDEFFWAFKCVRNKWLIIFKYLMGIFKSKEVKQEAEAEEKPQIIFILGGPGSGKGTQCADMVEKYGFNHYSTGDLLREFIQTNCEEAIQIKGLMSEGKLVPSKMLVDIVKKSIFKKGPNSQIYLIDGFPRSAENYEAWKEVMGNSVEIKTLLYLNCSLETLEKRLLERGKNSGRDDDNSKTILKRFKTYTEETTPFL